MVSLSQRHGAVIEKSMMIHVVKKVLTFHVSLHIDEYTALALYKPVILSIHSLAINI
jgi:hypothetical protein